MPIAEKRRENDIRRDRIVKDALNEQLLFDKGHKCRIEQKDGYQYHADLCSRTSDPVLKKIIDGAFSPRKQKYAEDECCLHEDLQENGI